MADVKSGTIQGGGLLNSPIFRAGLGLVTGGIGGAAMGALTSSNSPLGKMASMYGAGKSISDKLGTGDAGKMQGVQDKLKGNWNSAIGGDPVENLDPRVTVAKAAEALDHADLQGHPVLAYAAPELLAAHHFGAHGNGPLQDWYANQGGENT
jgi:hypothetical protein